MFFAIGYRAGRSDSSQEERKVGSKWVGGKHAPEPRLTESEEGSWDILCVKIQKGREGKMWAQVSH